MEEVYLSDKTFLSDLCARALYHPRVHVVDKMTNKEFDAWLTFANFTEYTSIRYELKLYLRPMSAMTDEEYNEYLRMIYEENSYTINDYLNSIHVDYRGIIPMGFAIEVTKDNNPYEKE